MTVGLVRILSYKIADEKEHSFSWRKKKKTDEKAMLCKSAFRVRVGVNGWRWLILGFRVKLTVDVGVAY